MLSVVQLKRKSGTDPKEVIRRGLEWTGPKAGRLVAEYLLISADTSKITILEADGFAPLAEMVSFWGDLYEITASPAITGDEYREMARKATRANA